MSYVAPIKDMLFCMKELAAIDEVLRESLAKGFSAAELANAATLRMARATLANADLTGRLATLAGARPALVATTPDAATLMVALAGCWERRVRVKGQA